MAESAIDPTSKRSLENGEETNAKKQKIASAAQKVNVLTINSTTKLRSGVEMPMFGLGTWLSEGGGSCKKAVEDALAAGYIHIDTAQMYKNEEDVGEALKNAKNIFVTSKLSPSEHGAKQTAAALETTLQKLQRESIDLFLIHTPNGGNVVETWKAVLEMKKLKKIRVAGVSNFGVAQLQALEATGLELPEVNQVELHIMRQQPELRKYCMEKQIAITGYCPLARVKQFKKHSTILDLAKKYGKTEAQIWIRWSLQIGAITIPKSTNPGRIVENANVFDFEFTEDEMKALEGLNTEFCASGSTKHQDLKWDEVK